MSLKYEPSSEPLRISAKQLFLHPKRFQADEWPHPDPALAETCQTVQALIEALR